MFLTRFFSKSPQTHQDSPKSHSQYEYPSPQSNEYISNTNQYSESTKQYPLERPVPQQYDDFSLLTQGFTIVREIGQGFFPVYEIGTVVNRKAFAMKTFSYKNGAVNPSYINEARFIDLKHPNIIHMICRNDRQESPLAQGGVSVYSYLVLEYAPNGDFFNLIMKYGDYFDDKIVRTYFKQLINALEYLQSNRIAHLDIKPENLLLGADYNLRVTDFDVSYAEGDKQILSEGTMSFRCPEMYKAYMENGQTKYPFEADIYSAGILLFVLKTGGVNPYFEDRAQEDVDLLGLMYNNNAEFWRQHCQLEEKPANFFDRDFIELFNGMTRADPRQRLTIAQIKNTNWYNGPTYNNMELQEQMRKILSMQPNA